MYFITYMNGKKSPIDDEIWNFFQVFSSKNFWCLFYLKKFLEELSSYIYFKNYVASLLIQYSNGHERSFLTAII